MLVPSAFDDVTVWFYQDLNSLDTSLEAWVAQPIKLLGKQKRNDLRLFLDDLLSDRYSAAELQEVWNKSRADIFFPKDEDLRGILRMIRRLCV